MLAIILETKFSPLSPYIRRQTKTLIGPPLNEYSTSIPSLVNENPKQVPTQSSRFSNIQAEALSLDQLKRARKYLAIRLQYRWQKDSLAQKHHGTLELGEHTLTRGNRKKTQIVGRTQWLKYGQDSESQGDQQPVAGRE